MNISNDQIDEMIMLKWGKYVTKCIYPAFLSNKVIGKLYGIDGSSV